MYLRIHSLEIDDTYLPPVHGAGSVEPLPRPDYHAKKHPRPAPRRHECKRRGKKQRMEIVELGRWG